MSKSNYSDFSAMPRTGRQSNSIVSIYTDGGCKGNPGKGAWAFYVEEEDVGMSGNERETTNNKMEITAALEALKWANAQNKEKVNIYTDSQYVQKGITEWIHNWKRNNWKTASKNPVKNKELWMSLDEICQTLTVQWCWIKGHAGHEGNERAHQLVTMSIDEIL